MLRVVVFDFDGVLADSFSALFSLIRDGMAHVGLSLTPDQYRAFFIGNLHQGYKNFINHDEKYLSFLEFRKNNYDKYYYDKRNGVKLFFGASEFIKKIKNKYILAVASSGCLDNVENLLKENNVRNPFSLVFADKSYTKEGMIQEVLDRLDVGPEEAIMISDTVGDILVAKEIGLKTIAATWGFHSLEMLEKTNPDFVVNDFTELLFKLTNY